MLQHLLQSDSLPLIVVGVSFSIVNLGIFYLITRKIDNQNTTHKTYKDTEVNATVRTLDREVDATLEATPRAVKNEILPNTPRQSELISNTQSQSELLNISPPTYKSSASDAVTYVTSPNETVVQDTAAVETIVNQAKHSSMANMESNTIVNPIKLFPPIDRNFVHVIKEDPNYRETLKNMFGKEHVEHAEVMEIILKKPLKPEHFLVMCFLHI